MERASAAARVVRPIDAGLLAVAARRAAAAAAVDDEPTRAIAASVETLYEAVAGIMPSVFVPALASLEPSGDGPRRGRNDGSGAVLADAMAATKAIEAEATAVGVCERLCKSLVFVVGATGCMTSRVLGDYVVDTTAHALREVSFGDEAAYRIADFPLTAEVLRTGEARSVSFMDGDVDPAEAFILRDLGMNALLMLPIRVSERAWGLVELYEMRLRRFGADDIAVARFLVAQAERRLESVADAEAGVPRPRVYELPSGSRASPRPRTR